MMSFSLVVMHSFYTKWWIHQEDGFSHAVAVEYTQPGSYWFLSDYLAHILNFLYLNVERMIEIY